MARVMSKSAALVLLLAMVLGTSAAPFESLRRMEQNIKQLHGHFKDLQPRHFGAKQAGGAQVISSGSYNFGSYSYDGSGSFSAACISAEVQVQVEAQQKCGDFDEISEVFDITSNTTVSLDKICSSTCQSFLLGLQSRFPACITADSTLGFKLINSMCTKDTNGQYCAQSLKSVQKLSCSDLTQTQCAYVNATRDCTWKWDYQSTYYSYGHCESTPTNATLAQVCSPCLDRFVLILGQQDNSYAQSTYQNYQNVLCAKQGNTYCYPAYQSIDSRIWDVSPTNSMNLTTIQSNVSTVCDNSDTKRCIAKIIGASASQQRQQNNAQFISCMKYSSTSYASYCVSSWVSGDRSASALAGKVDLFCATNDANKLCLPLLHSWARSPAIATLGYGQRCNNASAGNLSAMIADAGCCIDALNRADNTDFDPTQLPLTPNRIPNGSLPNVTMASWTSNPVYYYVTACASVAGFNATVQRQAASVQCRGMLTPPPQREVRLIGVLWEPIKSNATLKAKLAAACVSDMSAAIGVATTAINCSVVEDSSQSLTVSLTRRASTTGSGAKYQFTIAGSNDADAAANAEAFDTLQANNALTVPSTASTVSAQCTNCLAAGVSSTNLYAGLTGGDTSGTNSPTSSAAALSALSAVFAAVAVTLLL